MGIYNFTGLRNNVGFQERKYFRSTEAMSQSREPVYYWVKLGDAEIIAECVVNSTAEEQFEDTWYIPGREEIFYENEFDYISPSPITREPKEMPTEEKMKWVFDEACILKRNFGRNDMYMEGYADGWNELFNLIKSKINQ
jgi:hypothetical protein